MSEANSDRGIKLTIEDVSIGFNLVQTRGGVYGFYPDQKMFNVWLGKIDEAKNKQYKE